MVNKNHIYFLLGLVKYKSRSNPGERKITENSRWRISTFSGFFHIILYVIIPFLTVEKYKKPYKPYN